MVSINVSFLKLKCQESILKYLDRTNNLSRIKEIAEQYKTKIKKTDKCQMPIVILLELDVVLLTEISGLFSSLLVTEPGIAYYFVQEVVHYAASILADIPDLQIQDLQLLLRLKSIPALPGLVKIGPVGPSGLVLLQGVLVAHTFPTKYTRSAMFRCLESHCSEERGCRLEASRIQHAPHCPSCQSEMKENCRARDTGDRVLGLLVCPAALENSSSKDAIRHQSVLVCFQDELTVNLKLGVRYDVPGVQKTSYFEAWNLRNWQSGIETKVHHPGIPSLPLPPSICTLHSLLSQNCPQSPWALVTALAAQIASDIYPTTSLLHLKLGLLLSLASQRKNQPPVPILAVGPDTLIAHQVLNKASHLANRRIVVNSPSLWGPLEGIAHNDEQGNNWLEAGALLLSSSGVCFLGDWAKFKSVNLSSPILSVIESGKITIGTKKLSVSGPTPISPQYPLQSAVWTYKYWSPKEKLKEHSKLQALINVFGMPYLTDVEAEADNISRYILQRAINMGRTNKPFYIVPDCELQEYLAMAVTQPVKLGGKASQLIQDYFVASRRLRSHCLPVGAVSTITALSEAHASLRMSDEVSCEDVCMVLYLYEKAMVSLFGTYYVTPPPEPQMMDADNLPLQMHHQMTQFVRWLEKHIKSILGDISYSIDSEE